MYQAFCNLKCVLFIFSGNLCDKNTMLYCRSFDKIPVH